MLRNITKIISIAIVLAMVLGAFAVVSTALSAPSAPSRVDVKIADPERMYASKEFRNTPVDVKLAYEQLISMNGAELSQPGDIYDVGEKALYLTAQYGKWYWTNGSMYMPFTKMAEDNFSELWVCDDLTYLDGDPRNDGSLGTIKITESQAQYMVQHYREIIFPNMTAFFGDLPALDGENSYPKSQGLPYFGTNKTGRLMIMVFNIAYDQNFFTPSYPSYIAGFYSSGLDGYYDRNIINIDNWDWLNRTTGTVPRPWVYESTVAHELQHLIHDFYNPAEVAFVNEGCSMYSEILCGYGIDPVYLDYFFATPDNSLVDWEDQGNINSLADYGQVGMFTAYLADHFGKEIVPAMVHTDTTGIDTINNALQVVGASGWDFDKVFQYWRLANLILADSPGMGWFNYHNIDFSGSVLGGPRVYDWSPVFNPYVDSAAFEFGPSITVRGYDTGVTEVGAYGTDYIHVVGGGIVAEPGVTIPWSEGLWIDDLKFMFQGEPEVPMGWQLVDVPVEMGDVLFYEGFDYDGFFPDGWATESLGGYAFPWFMYTNDGFDYYALASSDWAGGGIDELLYMTEGIDTTDASGLLLTFDMDFQRYAPYADFGTVLFSVDGGDTWKTLSSWPEDSNPRGAWPMVNSVSIQLDIGMLAGYEDVRFAFRYTAEDWDWYWAIDDIMVSEVSRVPAWWSDNDNLMDTSLETDLDLTEMEGAELSMLTRWSIEDYWDFGFLQVSADGGLTWTSVANDYTTMDHDPDVDPATVAQLPGITGTVGYGGFGWDSFEEVTWDLSAWAGQSVKVRLHYITDPFTTYDGWYVVGAALNGEAIALDAWSPSPAYPENDWMVTLYFPGAVGLESKVYMLPIMTTLTMDDVTEMVLRTITSFAEYPEMYILVSPIAGPSDYGFGMDSFAVWD